MQFNSLSYGMDTDSMESVQRRLQNTGNLTHEDRLGKLNLHLLVKRRVRGELKESLYK